MQETSFSPVTVEDLLVLQTCLENIAVFPVDLYANPAGSVDCRKVELSVWGSVLSK